MLSSASAEGAAGAGHGAGAGSLGSSRSMRGLIAAPSHQNVMLGMRAVFVSDMSGFTRITRKMGITHFASLIMMMRKIVWPRLEKFGAEVIQPHADNFYAIFKSVEAATRAAASISKAIAAYNEGKEADYQISLGGMGVSWGADVRNLGHTLHGVPVQEAFVLGEDVCDGGNLLVTTAAFEQLEKSTSSAIRALKFAKREEEHPYAGTVEGMPDTIEYYEITNPTAVGEDVAVPDFVIPNAQGDKFLHLAEQRLVDASQREDIDKLVAREFMHFRVALMFGAHGEEALTKTRGLDYSLEIQRRKQALLRPIVEANSGDLAEPQLIFFESCHDAFLAAIQLRAALNTYNQEHPQDRIPVDSIGVHCGSVLLVPGTDIHWGDPVNTASKLGEDIGRVGMILLSKEVHDSMSQLKEFKKHVAEGLVKYHRRREVISKVELDVFELDIGVGAAEVKAVEKLSSALRKVHKAVKSLSTLHRGLSRRNVVGPNRSAKSFGSNGTAPATIAEDSVAHVEDAKEDLSRSDRHAKHVTSGAHDPDPSLRGLFANGGEPSGTAPPPAGQAFLKASTSNPGFPGAWPSSKTITAAQGRPSPHNQRAAAAGGAFPGARPLSSGADLSTFHFIGMAPDRIAGAEDRSRAAGSSTCVIC